MGALVAPISMALTCRVEEPSTASQPDSCAAANGLSMRSPSPASAKSVADFDAERFRVLRARATSQYGRYRAIGPAGSDADLRGAVALQNGSWGAIAAVNVISEHGHPRRQLYRTNTIALHGRGCWPGLLRRCRTAPRSVRARRTYRCTAP